MIGSIIVPLDGSAHAEAALQPALALAEGFGAELVLFRATFHQPPDEETRYLEVLDTKVAYGRTRRVVTHGFADTGLSELVAGVAGPILCLTARGASQAGGFLMGGVARDIVNRVVTPAVLIGPSCTGMPLAEGSRALVWCFNGSQGASRLEPEIVEWAAALGLRVEVVTVLHRHGTFLGDLPADNVRESAAAAMERIRQVGIDGRVVELEGLDVAAAITDHVGKAKPALVAAGVTAWGESRGVALLSRTFLGTTAERIVRRSPAPVLLTGRSHD
jgi:nucleotide-binding universal stress UspA family protein